MSYRYYNNNKLGKNANDCSVRAIALATHNSWDNVYQELSNLARINGVMMDDKDFIEDYLDSHFSRTCYNRLYMEDFINDFPKGTYIVSMIGHLTCVIDGVNYDTFDTRDRLIKCSWKVN